MPNEGSPIFFPSSIFCTSGGFFFPKEVFDGGIDGVLGGTADTPHRISTPVGGWEPLSLGHDAGLLPGANPSRQEPAACAARTLGTQHVLPCLPSSAPPARLIYAAPHFLLVSMPLSPLPPFFFFIPLVLPVHCLAPFFFPLLLAGLPVIPESCDFLGLPASVHSKWAFIPPEEGTVVPITPCWDMVPGWRGGYFYFYFYSILWLRSASWVFTLGMLLALGSCKTSGVATGAHRLRPDAAAGRSAGHLSPPARHRPAGRLPGVCRAARAGIYRKKKNEKVPVLLCLPPFHMYNLSFGGVFFGFVLCLVFFPPPRLPCQAHRKFAGSCVRVRMPNNFISRLEGSQRGVHRAGGGCWGACSFISLSQLPPPLCLPWSPAGRRIGVILLFYFFYMHFFSFFLSFFFFFAP